MTLHIGQARVHEAKLAGGLAELTLGVALASGVAPNLRHDLRGEREAAGEERPYERLVEHLWSALNCDFDGPEPGLELLDFGPQHATEPSVI